MATSTSSPGRPARRGVPWWLRWVATAVGAGSFAWGTAAVLTGGRQAGSASQLPPELGGAVRQEQAASEETEWEEGAFVWSEPGAPGYYSGYHPGYYPPAYRRRDDGDERDEDGREDHEEYEEHEEHRGRGAYGWREGRRGAPVPAPFWYGPPQPGRSGTPPALPDARTRPS